MDAWKVYLLTGAASETAQCSTEQQACKVSNKYRTVH